MKEQYKYYFTLRPPMIGTHPAGEILGGREVWQPVGHITLKSNGKRIYCHGFVTYAEPLSDNQVDHYDLVLFTDVTSEEPPGGATSHKLDW